MNVQDIIIRPILSEKSYAGIANKRYTFEVAKTANKTEIKLAVEAIFSGAKVEKVNTSLIRGKMKRMGKNEGMTSTRKKAFVQLTAESKPLEFFESLS